MIPPHFGTLTHPFNSRLPGTTQVSRYQKDKTNLDFTEARDSDWQWHQLDHMQVCTLLQADNHARTLPLSFFTGRMPFLPPNQQRQSSDGSYHHTFNCLYITVWNIWNVLINIGHQRSFFTPPLASYHGMFYFFLWLMDLHAEVGCLC